MTAMDNGARAQMALVAQRSVGRLAGVLEGSPTAEQLRAYMSNGQGYGDLEATLAAGVMADVCMALLERIEALESGVGSSDKGDV